MGPLCIVLQPCSSLNDKNFHDSKSFLSFSKLCILLTELQPHISLNNVCF